MIKNLLLLINLLNVPFHSSAQGKWDLVKNQDGIKVYTRKLDKDRYKEIKANFELNATQDQLIGVLRNISHQKDWSYGTKSTVLINDKKQDTLIYYSEISLPWPLSNRDLVIELTFKKDTINKLLYIQAKSIPGLVPVKPDLVRVPYSLATWKVNTLPGKTLKVEYTFSTNPGGAIPAWLVNFAASTGPYNSFHKLKEVVQKKFNNNLTVGF